MPLLTHALTHAGTVRSQNEDRVLLQPQLGLFAVCDGMGGQRHGELAAELAVASLRHFVASSWDPHEVTWPYGYDIDLSTDANRISTALRIANRSVWRKAEQELECAGMGTTVAAVLFQEDHFVAANVGDSRVYLLHADKLQQISLDDTLTRAMVEQGLITPEKLKTHPMRNLLTQSLGSSEKVDVHLREHTIEHGDILLLCSDGLYGVLEAELIHELLAANGPVEAVANSLIQAALDHQATDNISAIVIRSNE